MTALHLAARRGQTEVVRLLLSAGSDKDPKTKDCGATPLHLAAMKAFLELETEKDGSFLLVDFSGNRS